MRIKIILGVGLGLLLAAGSSLFWWVPNRQNVILICKDTVRYDTFWLAETAALPDAVSGWGKRALRFNATQSVSSWTLPAVASVMSGLLPELPAPADFLGR